MLNLRELLQQRSATIDQMRAIGLDSDGKSRNLTGQEEKQFDRLEKLALALDSQIKSCRAERDADMNLNLPGLDPSRRGGAPTGNWKDAKTGKEIRVLGPGDRMATERSPYGFGEFIRAAVCGTRDAELRSALTESGSGGNYLINPILSSEIIDALRAKTVMFRAGARLVELQSPITYMARVASDATTIWHDQGVDDLTAAEPNFDRITFTSRTLGTVFKISRELLEDAPDVNLAVQDNSTKAMALALDQACLSGNGALAPLGLDGLSLTSYAGGLIADYRPVTKGVGVLMTANAAQPTAAVMAPEVSLAFADLQDTLHQPLRRPDIIQNLPFLDTTSVVPSGSPISSKIYTGDYSQMMIGIRAELSIRLLIERFATEGNIGVFCWLRADMAVRHKASFVIATGVTHS